jgi:tRNA(Ile)-lysidine synthase
MGPHPSVAAVRRAVRVCLESLLNSRCATPGCGCGGADRQVLVACSGGVDSLALAAATAFVAPRLGITAGLVTVDHGLQDGSAERAHAVAGIGYELGLDPVEVLPVRVGRSGGPEAAARAARYAALEAAGAALDAHVLLGHTLDDQAETVLLGLGRGSGPRSIAGMRAEDGRYLRPLLGVRRAVTVEACAQLGLPAWDDPHNADPSYQRVRLRTEVLPLLEDVLQGGVAEALARTAELVRADLDFVDQQTESTGIRFDRSVDHGGVGVDIAPLTELPAALRSRTLRTLAAEAGAGPLTATHVAALDALVTGWHGQGPVDLPGGLRATRASGRIEFIPSVAPLPDPQES